MAWSVALAGFIVGVLLTIALTPATRQLGHKISADKKAVELEESRIVTISQILHLAIQGAPSGVCVVTDNGTVVLSNILAHKMGIVVDRRLADNLYGPVEDVFASHQDQIIDIAGPKASSRITSVKAHIQPLTHADYRFVLIYATDESENVRMEAARRDFVANVSHELKTPVGGMALLAEALIEAADDPDQVASFGEQLTREAHRLASMINELISLSKLQGAERLPDVTPVKVDDIIDAAIARNQLAADTCDITLTRDEHTDTVILGDEQLLVTALSNLVSNAINYSPQHTTVSITQETLPADGEPTHVALRVTDRGIGIAPEDQKRVFERFFRVDKARSRRTGGTGLGLAIVKHVVANHGGDITLWSRPNTGSTFTMKLPLQQQATQHTIVALDSNPASGGDHSLGEKG